MRVTVIGAGYVGLVVSACLAEAGHEVTAVDRDPRRLTALSTGKLPLFEPGLDALVREVTANGSLQFSDRLPSMTSPPHVVFIAVGTPGRRDDGTADVSTVMEAAHALTHTLMGPATVVIKSTVPVGTAQAVQQVFDRAEVSATVVSNPEFLRQGAALQDCRHPARILLGSPDPSARANVREVYAHHTAPVLEMDWASAELAKYASNAFLAMKVAFVNEMADLCEATGADVRHVAGAMGGDARIGADFLRPSPGFGGSCFPKDTLALWRMSEEVGAPSVLAKAVVQANTRRVLGLGGRVESLIGPLPGKRIGVLGLAFKPGTDDLRSAPAHALLPYLLERGATVVAHDPHAVAGTTWPDLAQVSQAVEVARGSDLVVLLTPWPAYRMLDLTTMARSMRHPTLLDLHNFFATTQLDTAGFRHRGVGRGSPG